MKVSTHTLNTTWMTEVVPEYEEMIRKRLEWLSQGKADVQEASLQIVQFSLWTGAILLALGGDDLEIRRYFRLAVKHGLKSLGAIGSSKRLRWHHLLFEQRESGTELLAQHEIRPTSRGPRVLSIDDYDNALIVAVCFGEPGEIEVVARYPENKYRNPGVIAGPGYWGVSAGLEMSADW